MRMLLFYIVVSAMCSLTSTSLRQYHYINTPKTWFEAQKYCRDNHEDLATVANQQDHDLLLSTTDTRDSWAWIGLYDDVTKWKWSLDEKDFDNNTDFSNWKRSNPNMLTYGHICVAMSENGFWVDKLCSTVQSKICYDALAPSKYKKMSSPMTWEEAQHYCRNTYTDLASVRSMSENDNIVAEIENVSWIGLHRYSWANWSDRSPMTFTNWDTAQETSNLLLTDQFYCALVNMKTGLWYITLCEYQSPFFCQSKVPEYTNRFKLKLKSDTDLSNAAVQSQILQQLHEKLEKHGIPDFKLRWIQTDGQTFDEEPKKKKKC